MSLYHMHYPGYADEHHYLYKEKPDKVNENELHSYGSKQKHESHDFGYGGGKHREYHSSKYAASHNHEYGHGHYKPSKVDAGLEVGLKSDAVFDYSHVDEEPSDLELDVSEIHSKLYGSEHKRESHNFGDDGGIHQEYHSSEHASRNSYHPKDHRWYELLHKFKHSYKGGCSFDEIFNTQWKGSCGTKCQTICCIRTQTLHFAFV